MLCACNTNRNRQAKLAPYAATDRARNVGGRTEQMRAARYIRKGLIDRNTLDEGSVVSDDFDRGSAQPLVLAEMPLYENQLRAELPRIPSGHAALHTEGLGFIGSRQYDPAADRDRLAAQRGVEQLLH